MTTVTNKNGIEFDIDAIATDLNNKVDLDGTNATYPHIVSRTKKQGEWGVVEIWSDGYCIQTGCTSLVADYGTYTVQLSPSYVDTTYIVHISVEMPSGGDDGQWNSEAITRRSTKTNSSFQIFNRGSKDGGRFVYWRTEGYIR